MKTCCGFSLVVILWANVCWAQPPREIVRLPDQPPGLVETFRDHKITVGALAFAPDGRWLASGGDRALAMAGDTWPEDYDVRIWDVVARKLVRTLTNKVGPIRKLKFSPDGRRLAAVTAQTGDVLIWDPTTGQLLKTFSLKSLKEPGIGMAYDLEFQTDRRAIIVGNNGHRLIDLEDLNVVSRWNGHEGITFSLALPAKSGTVLSGASDRIIRMWDIERGSELRSFTADGQQIEGLRVTPDGRWLASRTFDSTFQVWDLVRGESIFTLPGFQRGGQHGRPFALTPDGSRLLYSRLRNNTLVVADARTGRDFGEYTGHEKALTDIVVHPGGTHAATAGYDGLVKLWRLPDSKSPTKRPIAPAVTRVTPVTPTVPAKPIDPQAERRAAEWLVKVGAEFSIRRGQQIPTPAKEVPKEDGFHIWSINLRGKMDLKDEDLKNLSGLQGLSSLSLMDTNFNGTGLVNLADCSQLSSLELSKSKINDEGLKSVGKLTNLGTLHLQHVTEITDSGLAGLADLTKLRVLRIRCPGVTGTGLAALPRLPVIMTFDAAEMSDESLRHISRWPSLEYLYLSASPVTDAGLEPLAALKNLKAASFFGSRVSGTGLSHLKGCEQLSLLILDQCPVTAEGLQMIGGLSALQRVMLSDTGVKDEMLVGLKPLKQLHTLHLSRTPITGQAIETLAVISTLRNVHVEGTRLTAEDRERWLDRLPGREIVGP